MELNGQSQLAWNFVEFTSKSVFLTGKAGTGKTTFLRKLVSDSSKSVVVVAPTGVAAVNAGGVTIHSFFQLPLTVYVPGCTQKGPRFNMSKEKLRIIRAMDLLVIDEVSMVRADLLDAVDATLRRYRGNPAPFGGVQLLMIGDLQQLSPVVRAEEREILAPHYDTPFFFSSKALARLDYVTIELTEVFRQGDDPRFVALLNNIRDNCLTADDRRLLEQRWKPMFSPSAEEGYIRLTTHNALADDYNRRALERLPGEAFELEALVDGDFPEQAWPVSSKLVLKRGAQVMFLRNDSEQRYFNGKIGTVVDYDPEVGVTVRCAGDAEPVTVEWAEWENTKYTVDDATQEIKTEVIGKFRQVPLRPAWAITIHKSQGLTFDKVVIDAGAAFAPGQVYVALSRCRTLAGVVLVTRIPSASIVADSGVVAYLATQREGCSQILMNYQRAMADYCREMMCELYDCRSVSEPFEKLREIAGRMDRSFITVSATLLAVSERLQADVTEIAARWCARIKTTDDATLDSDQFRGAEKRGARYFLDKLEEILIPETEQIFSIATANKVLQKRLDEYRNAMHTALNVKMILLRYFSGREFSVEEYLVARRKATLLASKPQKRIRSKRKR